MNRYALWKCTVIAVALLVGFIHSLSNLFPGAPAVQVSSSMAGVKLGSVLLSQAQAALKEAGIGYSGEVLDPTGIKLRFAAPDTQLKAQDALQARLGDNSIVALNLVSSSPQWLTEIGALPMFLGLDLRGGARFLLQVDMKAALDKALERYPADIRSLLREKTVQYVGISREGANVVVRFRHGAERNKARNEIALAFADLAPREADAAGDDLPLVVSIKPEAHRRIEDAAVQPNMQILRNRVNELGVAEPIVQQQGRDRVVLQLPGVQDTARAKDILGRTALLEIRLVNDEPGALGRALAAGAPMGSEIVKDRAGTSLLVGARLCRRGTVSRTRSPASIPTTIRRS